MKKISMILVLVMMFSAAAFAEGAIRDAGNKICPVSGEAVSGSAFVEHEGVRYGLCCSACAKKFQANPEKYITQLAQGSSAAVQASEDSDDDMDHADHAM